MNVSLLVSAGIAAAGIVLALIFLPRSALGQQAQPPRRKVTNAGQH